MEKLRIDPETVDYRKEGIEEWWCDRFLDDSEEYDTENLTPEYAAYMVKQFGFDWVCGEEDTKEVYLSTIGDLVKRYPEALPEIKRETSQILLDELEQQEII